jgi:subtilisin-like proprotein convertase family protein
MRRVLFAIGAVGLIGVFAAPAAAATFTNPGAIAINDSSTFICPPDTVNQAPATPYPSQIPVSGLGAASDVNVTVNGFSHTSPPDVRMLLVGPQGQSTQLLSDAGAAADATNLTITFDDSAPTVVPNPMVSGTFKPSQENTGCTTPMSGLSFASPAPPAPYGTSLAGFNGSDPNGAWSLYVVDNFQLDTGSISGGWSLDIAAPPAPTHKKCKKHKKKHHRAAAAKKKCKKHKKKHHR